MALYVIGCFANSGHPASSWMQRLQSVREDEVANPLSLIDPVFHSEPEVNARVDARFSVLVSRLREGGKRSRYAREWGSACGRKRHIVATEEPAQHFGSGAS